MSRITSVIKKTKTTSTSCYEAEAYHVIFFEPEPTTSSFLWRTQHWSREVVATQDIELGHAPTSSLPAHLQASCRAGAVDARLTQEAKHFVAFHCVSTWASDSALRLLIEYDRVVKQHPEIRAEMLAVLLCLSLPCRQMFRVFWVHTQAVFQ